MYPHGLFIYSSIKHRSYVKKKTGRINAQLFPLFTSFHNELAYNICHREAVRVILRG